MSYTPMFSDVPPPAVHTHGGAQFTAAAVDRIAELLETLVTLGQARGTEGRYTSQNNRVIQISQSKTLDTSRSGMVQYARVKKLDDAECRSYGKLRDACRPAKLRAC